MRIMFVLGLFLIGFSGISLAQPFYDNETQDFGIAPPTQIRTGNLDAPTPTTIQGVQTITTIALRGMIGGAHAPVLIDVLGGNQTVSLPGAVWLRGAGLGHDFNDDVQQKLSGHLAQVTGGDQARQIVFFCLSRNCWLSVNAAMRAVKLGYTSVYWYRGGCAAWQAAGFPMEAVHGSTF